MDLPEVALVNVLVRFPLKSIVRFRLISREWKSLIDSDFFRDLYTSFNSSSSVSWSIIQTKPHKLSLEIAGHHGCETWGLTKSPGSLVSFFAETTIKKLLVLACTDGLVSICAEASDDSPMYYIGNPLTQEWFRIPQPPFRNFETLRKHLRFSDSGLVTKMENGVVVSYKVVWLLTHADKVEFMIYSSDTGTWERRNVNCLHSTMWTSQDKSIALNGILHWLSNLTSSIITYDFYGVDRSDDDDNDDECCIVLFPDSGNGYDELRRCFRRTFTTSEGSIVYFNEFRGTGGKRTLRVWKLVKYSSNGGPEAWQVLWEVRLVSLIEMGIIDYFPVVMHPLNSEIIYLWSRNRKCLVLFNLRTLSSSLHKETQGDSKCMDGSVLSFNGCLEYIESVYRYYLPPFQVRSNSLLFSQYVLPRWLHRLPRPNPT